MTKKKKTLTSFDLIECEDCGRFMVNDGKTVGCAGFGHGAKTWDSYQEFEETQTLSESLAELERLCKQRETKSRETK